jgi:phospholipid/cholesterol/gamma-HCH transport system substrate-binding protein
MNDQAIRFRIGIFVLAALLVLAVLITLFGGFPSYFRKADTYPIIFDNAQGVSAGTPVLRSGVKIGEVRSVQLNNETGKVRVVIAIEEGYYLRWGDHATIIRNPLGGDATIVFMPPSDQDKDEADDEQPPPPEEKKKAAALEGKKAGERIPPGTELRGYNQTDVSQILQKMADVATPIEETMAEMRRVFRQLDKLTPLFKESLEGFRDLAKSGRDMGPELRKTNVELQELAKTARTMAPELEKTSIELRELAKTVRVAVPTFEKTGEEIRALAKSSRDVVPELRRTTEEAGATARTWNRLGERADVLLQTNEKSITRSIDQLQEALRRTNDVLSDENTRNLRDTLRNVRVGSERVDSIARNADETLKDTRIAVKQLTESLRRADAVLLDIQRLTGPFGERSPGLFKNVDEAAEKLNRAMTDVRELIRVIANNDGTVQKLLSDPSLYNNLNDTACMVTRLLPRVDQMLRDFGIFADKLARHPEALGLGGVVRPSSGLKEAPSTTTPWRMLPRP